MLLGHRLEMKAVTQAQGALNALAALLPDTAERVTETGIEKVPLAELRVGDVVLVRPGSRVPVDGIVVEGTADVDESVITGEPRTIPKTPTQKNWISFLRFAGTPMFTGLVNTVQLSRGRRSIRVRCKIFYPFGSASAELQHHSFAPARSGFR